MRRARPCQAASPSRAHLWGPRQPHRLPRDGLRRLRAQWGRPVGALVLPSTTGSPAPSQKGRSGAQLCAGSIGAAEPLELVGRLVVDPAQRRQGCDQGLLSRAVCDGSGNARSNSGFGTEGTEPLRAHPPRADVARVSDRRRAQVKVVTGIRDRIVSRGADEQASVADLCGGLRAARDNVA